MTRSDIYDLIAIIEDCKKQEMKYCEEYCKLNPEDAQRRNRIGGDIISGMNRVWNAINDKYKYLKEENV